MKRVLGILYALFAAVTVWAQTSIRVEVHNIVELSERFNVVFVVEGEHTPTDFSWSPGDDFTLVWGPQKGLLFFTQKYPGKHNTTDYIFVKQLVDAMAGLGHECHVVAPYNILHYMKYSKKHEVYQIGSGSVTVYRPYYLSFSDFKVFEKIAFASKRNAIRKAVSRLPEGIDVAYGHFWRSAYEGYDYARNHNILKDKDVIDVTIKDLEEVDIVAQDIPLDIVYEDSDIIVINKPSGMVRGRPAGCQRCSPRPPGSAGARS